MLRSSKEWIDLEPIFSGTDDNGLCSLDQATQRFQYHRRHTLKELKQRYHCDAELRIVSFRKDEVVAYGDTIKGPFVETESDF